MRPPGEIRAALLATIEHNGAPLALRDAAQRANVGLDAARRTFDNCIRSGALEIVGKEKRGHCDKWVALYDVPRSDAEEEPMGSAAAIDLAMTINTAWR